MKNPCKTKSSISGTNNSTGQTGAIIVFLLLFSFSILIGRFTTLKSPILVLGLMAGLIIALVTLVNTNLALIILIFSMLLSPEIPIIHVPERAVVLRIDDILVVFMFFTWLAKIAINKQLGFLKNTPITKPLLIYTLLFIVITALAIVLRISYAKFSTAFFYILKYFEYFLIFFLVSNNLKSLKQIKIFNVFFLLVCFIICIAGYYQIKMGVLRVSAPFEGQKPEPNTLAGYLLVMFGLVGGLLLHSKSLRLKLLLGGLFLFMVTPFLFTLSRGGYIGFIGLYSVFLIFARKRRMALATILLISIVVLPQILPLAVIERVKMTFTPHTTGVRYEALGHHLRLEEAAAARVETWRWLTPLLLKSPLFGYGVMGVGFVDSQYARVLGELGIIGFLVFLWIVISLFRNALRIYRSSEDGLVQGVSLGFLAILVSLLIQSIGANVFVIVRIMEPFWFLAAVVLMSPELLKNNAKAR